MRRRPRTAAGLAALSLVAAASTPALAGVASAAKRPTVATWHTSTGPTYTNYANVSAARISDHGKKISHLTFRPNNGVMYCTPGRYAVVGSFAIRKGGAGGYPHTKFHIGHKVGHSYQLNVAYSIDGKRQPGTTSLEVDFTSPKRAHVEFGPYGTASCNLFWEIAPR